ncbi:carboxysome peptide A [Thiomicrorhabdus sp.]|uniref:carboxysome peptide A n=1 Tax=Thiomicrorhabdus sp. TaxID=2039724 RepID=UPI0035665AB7
MKIYQLDKTLVSTNRIASMEHKPLLVVREKEGGSPQVAVDPVGCKPGDWVICCGSSAARDATGVKGYPSDLTIVGIIDKWEAPQNADTSS